MSPSPRRLPPLTALRALEAIHQTGSVTAAAARLNVSHSAVSHQVRILEAWTTTPLFLRRGRTLDLTPAGRSLAAVTQEAFDTVRHEIDRLPLRGLQAVTVAALPLVVQRLILPELAAFLGAHPGLRVHLMTGLADRPVTPPPDLQVIFVRRQAILAGDDVLLPGDAAPCATPALIAAHGGDPEALLRRGPLIHDEDLRMWPAWLAASGVARDEDAAETRAVLEGSAMIQQAVAGGMGAGFVRLALARPELESGAVVRCSEVGIDADWAYVLRADPIRAQAPEVATVSDWLRALGRHAAGPGSEGAA